MNKEKSEGYSIIIPAYKSEQFIKECLDSIQRQDFFEENQNYEILLGIDGCADTLNKVKYIMREYNNLRVFYFEKNRGPYITKNTLIDEANYNYLLFFDSDDQMKVYMISEIDSIMSEGYDACRFYYVKYENGKNPESGVAHNKVSEGVTCHRREVHEILGGFEEWPCGADSDFRFKCDNLFEVFHIERPLFFRRTHPNSLTQRSEYGLKSKRRQQYLQTVYKRMRTNYYKNPKRVESSGNQYEEITQ